MPLVPHIVRHDLMQLGEALARLERVSRGLSLEAYRADEVKRAACERFLEQAIQECIHINEHVARQEWGVTLANAHEGFRLWGEHGIMPVTFASEVARAAGLRNRLHMRTIRLMMRYSSRLSQLRSRSCDNSARIFWPM